jgi:hypothetical protein
MRYWTYRCDRYKGFADLMRMFSEIGLLNNKEGDKILLEDWNELVARAASKAVGEQFETKQSLSVVSSILGTERTADHGVIPALKW